jgi:hypothetical protein
MKPITAAINDIASMPWQQCVTAGDSPEVKICRFGSPSARTSIVLFGDSHALQWFNPVRRIVESNQWELTTILKLGCPAADVRTPRRAKNFVAGCDQWRADAIRQITALRPTLVVIGSASLYMDRPSTGDRTGLSIEQWKAGTSRTLRQLADAGLRTALLRDTPIPSFNVPTCLAHSIRHGWLFDTPCAVPWSTAVNPAVFAAEKSAARNLTNVYFIDMMDEFCYKDSCWPVRSGVVVYRDRDHLTASFAERLRPVLEFRLQQILNSHRKEIIKCCGSAG